MGLDLNGIDLPLNMRLWHASGLRAILSDPETVKAAMGSSVRTKPPAARNQTPAPGNRQPAPSSSRPIRSAPPRPAASSATKPVPPQGPSDSRQPSPRKRTDSRETPQLPPSLQTYFSRLTVPSFSLWTYWDLAVDLGDSPNKGRQDLVKKMRQALAWPAGSSVFWPISRLEGGQVVADLDLFAFGVRTITPVYIFCFGEQGCRLLAPDKNPATLQRAASPHTSAMIQFLPSLNAMLPDNRELKNIAWKILKGYSPLPM